MPRPTDTAFIADLYRRWMRGEALSLIERQSINFLTLEVSNRQIARLFEARP